MQPVSSMAETAMAVVIIRSHATPGLPEMTHAVQRLDAMGAERGLSRVGHIRLQRGATPDVDVPDGCRAVVYAADYC
jgi:hypothetical protein